MSVIPGVEYSEIELRIQREAASHTFGTSPAALTLANLISDLPKTERHKVFSQCQRPIAACFQAIKLALTLPDKAVREETIRLWKIKSLEALKQAPALDALPKIRNYAINVLITGIRRTVRPRTPYGIVTRGNAEAPEKPCDGYFLTGPKVRMVAVSPRDLKQLMSQRWKLMTEDRLKAVELWAEDAYPGERLLLPEITIVAVAGEVSDMRHPTKPV